MNQNCSEIFLTLFKRPCLASVITPHSSNLKESVKPKTFRSDASIVVTKLLGFFASLPNSHIVCATKLWEIYYESFTYYKNSIFKSFMYLSEKFNIKNVKSIISYLKA